MKVISNWLTSKLHPIPLEQLEDELENKSFIDHSCIENNEVEHKSEQEKFLSRVMKNCVSYIAPKTIDEYCQMVKDKSKQCCPCDDDIDEDINVNQFILDENQNNTFGLSSDDDDSLEEV